MDKRAESELEAALASWNKVPNELDAKHRWTITTDGCIYTYHIFLDFLLNREEDEIRALRKDEKTRVIFEHFYGFYYQPKFDSLLNLCKSRVKNLESRLKVGNWILLHSWPDVSTNLYSWTKKDTQTMHDKLDKSDLKSEIEALTGRKAVLTLVKREGYMQGFYVTAIELGEEIG